MIYRYCSSSELSALCFIVFFWLHACMMFWAITLFPPPKMRNNQAPIGYAVQEFTLTISEHFVHSHSVTSFELLSACLLENECDLHLLSSLKYLKPQPTRRSHAFTQDKVKTNVIPPWTIETVCPHLWGDNLLLILCDCCAVCNVLVLADCSNPDKNIDIRTIIGNYFHWRSDVCSSFFNIQFSVVWKFLCLAMIAMVWFRLGDICDYDKQTMSR